MVHSHIGASWVCPCQNLVSVVTGQWRLVVLPQALHPYQHHWPQMCVFQGQGLRMSRMCLSPLQNQNAYRYGSGHSQMTLHSHGWEGNWMIRLVQTAVHFQDGKGNGGLQVAVRFPGGKGIRRMQARQPGYVHVRDQPQQKPQSENLCFLYTETGIYVHRADHKAENQCLRPCPVQVPHLSPGPHASILRRFDTDRNLPTPEIQHQAPWPGCHEPGPWLLGHLQEHGWPSLKPFPCTEKTPKQVAIVWGPWGPPLEVRELHSRTQPVQWTWCHVRWCHVATLDNINEPTKNVRPEGKRPVAGQGFPYKTCEACHLCVQRPNRLEGGLQFVQYHIAPNAYLHPAKFGGQTLWVQLLRTDGDAWIRGCLNLGAGTSPRGQRVLVMLGDHCWEHRPDIHSDNHAVGFPTSARLWVHIPQSWGGTLLPGRSRSQRPWTQLHLEPGSIHHRVARHQELVSGYSPWGARPSVGMDPTVVLQIPGWKDTPPTATFGRPDMVQV